MARISLLLIILFYSQLRAGEPVKLVGEARFTVLFWPIYDAQLFTPDGYFRENEPPITLKLTYLRDITSDELVNQTAKEWQRMGVDENRSDVWLSELKRLWPDVTKSDAITFTLDCEGWSHFRFNNTELGTIHDPAFGSAFMAIWLSEQTRQPSFRKELIGNRERSTKALSLCTAQAVK